MNQSRPDIHRRRLFQVVGLGVAAASVQTPASAMALLQRDANKASAIAALDRDVLQVAVVQSHVGRDAAANLELIVGAIDRIQTQAGKKDLIAFHASALHAELPAELSEARAIAIDLSGPVVAAIGAKAKQHGVYVSFSALTHDASWLGHVIDRQILIGPAGKIILTSWQTTHDESAPFLTSVERVLDHYVAMYGRDAVLPVARTSIGNIALASDQAAPEIYRALALKGAEIVIRAPRSASARWDVQACAAYNQCFTLAPARAAALHASSDEDAFALCGGGSLIIGPRGETLAESGSQWEQTITAKVPIAHARATRGAHNIHPALVLPIFAEQIPLA